MTRVSMQRQSPKQTLIGSIIRCIFQTHTCWTWGQVCVLIKGSQWGHNHDKERWNATKFVQKMAYCVKLLSLWQMVFFCHILNFLFLKKRQLKIFLDFLYYYAIIYKFLKFTKIWYSQITMYFWQKTNEVKSFYKKHKPKSSSESTIYPLISK